MKESRLAASAESSVTLRGRALLRVALLAALCTSCSEPAEDHAAPRNAISIGAALPFSGPKASTGISIERALMLAVEDVNAAGGVAGRPLHLQVRDSNSGSERGFEELRSLLRDDEVDYLVGPEEDQLALDLAGEVKSHDKLHILPSLSSPRIIDSGSRGAWLRLVPSALTMGCALASKVIEDGVSTTRTIAARDDYHLEFASVFGSSLSSLGGRALPTVTVADGQASYSKQISQVRRFDRAEATVMLAYPRTAAGIVSELARGERIRWYFSPMLRDEALLWNVPEGLLTDAVGVSPSLSRDSECEFEETPASDAGAPSTSSIDCSPRNAERFSRYFAQRWEDRKPLDSGHFYYDSVVMLALALEAADAAGNEDPTPQELLPFFSRITAGDGETFAWDEVEDALNAIRDGRAVHYVGAAGEYQFNKRGQNTRAIVTTWEISDHSFAESESVSCPIEILQD